MSYYKVISDAWQNVAERNKFRGRWVCDETWFRVLKVDYPSLESLHDKGFTRSNLNKAIASVFKHTLDDFTESNTTGKFRRGFSRTCPYDTTLKRKVWYYYVTEEGTLVERPPEGVQLNTPLEDATIRPSRSRLRDNEGDDVTRSIRQRISDSETSRSNTVTNNTVTNNSTRRLAQSFSYWNSPEARKLFAPSEATKNDSLIDLLSRRIEKLQNVSRFPKGWRDVIETHDKDNLCTPYDINIIRQKSQLLCLAYLYALDSMNNWQWMADCCASACSDLNRIGIAAATNAQTIVRWNQQFRSSERFQHPVKNKKQTKPTLVKLFPEAEESINGFCIKNIADLTIEAVQRNIRDELVPKLLQEHEGTLEEGSAEILLLNKYVRSPPGLTTVWEWMQKLNWRYSNRKKTYYVDGHERPAQKQHRREFCEKYLMEWERRSHRWVQMTKDELLACKEGGEMKNTTGYEYTCEDSGEEMVELHVDTCTYTVNKGNERTYGGNLSVRFPISHPALKPIVLLGQDECAFNQFLLGSRQWIGPKGQRALLPKTEGAGLMVSAFQSRELGFGLKISDAELEEINFSRMGKKYKDEEAGVTINKTANKSALTESPFVVYFELGANNEGYWTYNHMVLQFEDCVDCLTVMYPQFHFVFLFDHSSGHAKKRIDGLDAASMLKGFGGSQPLMHPAKIEEENGYLGPYDPTLEAGDVQSMVFLATDTGPFWMPAGQREETRHDRVQAETTVTRPKRIGELIEELTPNGIQLARRRYKLDELQAIARENGIATDVEQSKVLPGWQGKAKGLLQVLRERGFIDLTNTSAYTVRGRDDEDGNVDPDFSLLYLMESCIDFAEEITMLQHIGGELGVTVFTTPKFHAELAGEGVEYSWGLSKGQYRRKPLNKKKNKKGFHDLVHECTSCETITKERVRKFSRRARAYACAYYTFHQNEMNQRSINIGDDDLPNVRNENFLPDSALSLVDIESMVKNFKTHRCALDFDRGFINAVLMQIPEGNNIGAAP
jgi:hypothetical protein